MRKENYTKIKKHLESKLKEKPAKRVEHWRLSDADLPYALVFVFPLFAALLRIIYFVNYCNSLDYIGMRMTKFG